MDQGLFDRLCREASSLSAPQLREALIAITRCQQRARSESARAASSPQARKSFRTLTASGSWSNRKASGDPVRFTTQLRRRMERGEENK
jgi:hypothetical protein